MIIKNRIEIEGIGLINRFYRDRTAQLENNLAITTTGTLSADHHLNTRTLLHLPTMQTITHPQTFFQVAWDTLSVMVADNVVMASLPASYSAIYTCGSIP